MEQLRIPTDYSSPLTIRETEVAIKEVKDYFERALAKSLHLTRVSAPLFVRPESGLNDNLNGVERPVSFGIRTGRGTRRDRTFPCKMEKICSEKLRLSLRRGALHRYERHPPR